MSVTLVSASSLTIAQVTTAFNTAFEGYYFPMSQTPQTLGEMIHENDVSLDESLVLLINETIAGLCLLGVRGERGWIAGMGVGPAWRGQGLGKRMLSQMLDRIRAMGLREAQLEALTVNTPALNLYHSVGFTDVRELLVFQGLPGDAAALAYAHAAGQSLDIRLVNISNALTEFEMFHPVRPAWQRERSTLVKLHSRPLGLGLWHQAQLVAYVLYLAQPAGIVAVDGASRGNSIEEQRLQVAMLLANLCDGKATRVFRAINTPPGDPLGEALQWLGCPVVARQHELSLALV